MGCPRITIGDGSLYIQTEDLKSSWEISAKQILSPCGLKLNRVRVTVNGDSISRPIAVKDSVVIGFSRSATLTLQVIAALSGKLSISLKGASFSDHRWRAVGDDILFYDAPGVHIKSVTIDGTVYYQARDNPAPDRPSLQERFRRRSGCRVVASTMKV